MKFLIIVKLPKRCYHCCLKHSFDQLCLFFKHSDIGSCQTFSSRGTVQQPERTLPSQHRHLTLCNWSFFLYLSQIFSVQHLQSFKICSASLPILFFLALVSLVLSAKEKKIIFIAVVTLRRVVRFWQNISAVSLHLLDIEHYWRKQRKLGLILKLLFSLWFFSVAGYRKASRLKSW